MSDETKWVSGVIKTVNPTHNTGIIQKYDGENVIFNLADFEVDPKNVRVGQKVLYNLEKSNMGALAKKIMLLDSD